MTDPVPFLHKKNSLPVLPRFDFSIFMNTRTTVVSAVSCKSGNNNGFFCWILLCLLSKFFKTATLNVHSFEAFGKACLP
ncbi:hypothetical protein K7X08_037913 [Anisodus acutangulus]|uniref:Uncharacterized protein n=1 Tax=Anisodus acutangulus TaxID=402998 RepID=A0A9Q1RSG7_9SOLA|nr:hypothetical protein K7X08_037913 [Anisodus acutangulus]